MKKIIFFDVDNTIYNNKESKVPKNTKKLLYQLAQDENITLGLATGRGLAKLAIIEDVIHLFTYKILINGAVVMKGDDIIFEQPIAVEDIKEVIDMIDHNEFNIGMVALNSEAVNQLNNRVNYGFQAIRGIFPLVDDKLYEKEKIYQLWLFADNQERVEDLKRLLTKFRAYPWHQGGVDFTYPHINKSFGIKKALDNEKDYQLITVGDGANDIEMIEMADIGIAMANSKFTELKEKANHVAPHIDADQLDQVFKELKII